MLSLVLGVEAELESWRRRAARDVPLPRGWFRSLEAGGIRSGFDARKGRRRDEERDGQLTVRLEEVDS